MSSTSMDERVRDAKTRIREVTARDAMDRAAAGDVVLLDVREANEWNLFRVPGAVHLPLAGVPERVVEAVPRDRAVIVYCGSGNRSAIAADEMQKMGYADVSSLAGGIRAWANAGGELED